jgi:catechol 2,3-dioxygenase-like lactoylglutathione lyase family enzyme
MADATASDVDVLIPVLTVSDVDEAVEFYRWLGFDTGTRHGRYAVLVWGHLEMHLSEWDEHDPERTAGAVYLRTNDVDSLYERLRTDLEQEGRLYLAPASGLTPELTAELRTRLASGEQLVRLHEIADKPWGMRQFSVIDPSGNAVGVGRPLADT